MDMRRGLTGLSGWAVDGTSGEPIRQKCSIESDQYLDDVSETIRSIV